MTQNMEPCADNRATDNNWATDITGPLIATGPHIITTTTTTIPDDTATTTIVAATTVTIVITIGTATNTSRLNSEVITAEPNPLIARLCSE